MDNATQSLREDICRISGLLYRLQHWDVFSNPTISSGVSVNHPEPNLSLYNSLAIRLSTDSRRVAVTGRLTMESGLELVVASSDSATPIREKDVISVTTVPEKASIVDSLGNLWMALKRNTGDRLSLDHITRIRQDVIASDALLSPGPGPHTGEMRTILSHWTPSFTEDTGLFRDGLFVQCFDVDDAQIFATEILHRPNTRPLSKWLSLESIVEVQLFVNGLGNVLDGLANAKESNVMPYLRFLKTYQRNLKQEEFRIGLLGYPNLALALSDCYKVHSLSLEKIGDGTFELCPLPRFPLTGLPNIPALLDNYIEKILGMLNSAVWLQCHYNHQSRSSIPPVRVLYVFTGESRLELDETYYDALRSFLSVVDEEGWIFTRRWNLQQRVSASVHPEAALLCLPTCETKSNPLDPAMSYFFANLDDDMGVSHQLCYCCYLLRTEQFIRKGDQELLDLFLDCPSTHGRVLPWAPPAFGVANGALVKIRRVLLLMLRETVRRLRGWQDGMEVLSLDAIKKLH